MKIYIGADHRGFKLKNSLIPFLKDLGREVVDCGPVSLDMDDDFPDYAVAVAREVAKDPENFRGILICGSGGGMDIVANKVKSIRCTLAMSGVHVNASRRDDNVNVICLAADFLNDDEAKDIVKTFLDTPFAGQARHLRRLEKIKKIEDGGSI